MNSIVQTLSSEQIFTPSIEYNHAYTWIVGLTGNPEQTVFNWRFIHDQDKGKPAIKRRGTLPQMWEQACAWNAAGYGIFATVNEMDGTGYDQYGQPIQGISGDKKEHVLAVRAHVVDLDNLSAMENLQRATMHNPAPSFYVQTSPGKAHVYWSVERYCDNDFYELQQRKLRQYYDGDRAVVDVTRVLRVPGFYHRKGAPHLVTCHALPRYGLQTSGQDMAASLMHVNAPEDGGGRHKLGDPDLAAPSAEWALYGLESMPVDGMSHPDFISFTAAFKQAASTHLDPDVAKQHWLKWCEKFGADSKGLEYNLKHWDSIQDTEIGWKSMLRQNANLNAQFMFRGATDVPANISAIPTNFGQDQIPRPLTHDQRKAFEDELLLAQDQPFYFRGCAYVESANRIAVGRRLMKSETFQATYGGKVFETGIAGTGRTTDNAWKAATQGRRFQIPKVQEAVLRPDKPPLTVISENGIECFNIFEPYEFESTNEDVRPFLNHVEKMFPFEQDREHLYDWFAHNIKFPGVKIGWAPFIQSVQGTGKNVFKHLMQHVCGRHTGYYYSPKAQHLEQGGGKFNLFMQTALFVLVDEIKTNNKYELVKTLKPFISEKDVEIEGKGLDGRMGDNCANWAFFSNHKGGIPISRNERRFSPFFSAMQTPDDLIAAGMDDAYFNNLYRWIENGGAAAVAGWMMRRNVTAGGLPKRAPRTSSWDVAVDAGLNATATMIREAMSEGLAGFRNGWVSTKAIENLWIEQRGSINGFPQSKTLALEMQSIGLFPAGQASSYIPQEKRPGEPKDPRPRLYHKDGKDADPRLYMAAQGYGNAPATVVPFPGQIPGAMPPR